MQFDTWFLISVSLAKGVTITQVSNNLEMDFFPLDKIQVFVLNNISFIDNGTLDEIGFLRNYEVGNYNSAEFSPLIIYWSWITYADFMWYKFQVYGMWETH